MEAKFLLMADAGIGAVAVLHSFGSLCFGVQAGPRASAADQAARLARLTSSALCTAAMSSLLTDVISPGEHQIAGEGSQHSRPFVTIHGSLDLVRRIGAARLLGRAVSFFPDKEQRFPSSSGSDLSQRYGWEHRL